MGIATFARRYSKEALLRLLQGPVTLLDTIQRHGQVVVYYGWPDFARKANAVAFELTAAGIPAVVHTGTGFLARARVKLSSNLHIGFWNHFYPEYLPERYIFYNAEPLQTPRWRDNEGWRALMKKAQQVWGYSEFDRQYVTALNLPFHCVPFGYSPYYEWSFQHHLQAEQVPQDVDVLFFGFVSERRRVVLEQIREAGLRVEVVTYDCPLRGASLDRMIARAKIVLSMFATDDPAAQVPDLARLDHLLSNKRFVLHEQLPAGSRDPAFEQHVPTSAYDRIAENCVQFLRSPEARAEAALTAHRWFKEHRALSATLPFEEVRRLIQ